MPRMLCHTILILAIVLVPTLSVVAQNQAEAPVPPTADAPQNDTPAKQTDGDEATQTEPSDEGDSDQADEPKKSETEQRLEALKEERALLTAEHQLAMQKQTNALAAMALKKNKIEAEMALQAAKHAEALAEMKREIETVRTRAQFEAAKRSETNAAAKIKAEQLALSNELLAAQVNQAKQELALAKAKQSAELNELTTQLAAVEAKRKLNQKVDRAITYRTEPFKDGILEVTDRRIALNGTITSRTADYITERLHFFNNKSTTQPIFIVIDASPGGSVMAGYRIVEAMEASDAPVHVLVKSFAASMAAVITTLAEHSYAYPNAVLLHHQMSSGMRGNLTQQKEALENAQEWARRLMEPVCEKIGMTQKQFVEAMYKNNSNGDWSEFATEAAKLKWVNHVVSDVRELAVVEHPESRSAGSTQSQRLSGAVFQAEEQVDSEGSPFVRLPRLGPFDHWFMYDPQNYYR